MPAVNMLDAKTNLSRLVEKLEQGVEREYVIARLVPFGHAGTAQHRIGLAKGQFTVPDDIDAHNNEVAHLFQGGSAV